MNDGVREMILLLSEECGWPIDPDMVSRSAWKLEHDELGLNEDVHLGVEVYELRPLVANQPWGVFFLSVDGEDRLSVTLLRRLLRGLVKKKRATAEAASRKLWDLADLMFVCSLDEPDNSTRYFAHFRDTGEGLPKLMIGARWDGHDKNHFKREVEKLRRHLRWPDDESDTEAWRKQWRAGFQVGHREVIKTSATLSKELARFARDIRNNIPDIHLIEREDGPIHTLHAAFRGALIEDLDLSDFSDMVAQTIAYGLFSARATGTELSGIETLSECIPSTNPFLRNLFSKFASLAGDKPTDLDFDDLSLDELVQMLNQANIDAVMGDFGNQFRKGKENPTIHFFEDFLTEYDKEIKKDRGVWYTPQPVVDYIVERVHLCLIENHGIPLGLADSSTYQTDGKSWHRVMILDPATGTGTFLCSAVSLIHRTMTNHWKSEGRKMSEIVTLWSDYVIENLLPRIVGFEIMMAPYTIAHLNLSLQLTQTGFKLGETDRINIILTNSLESDSGITDFIPDFLAEEAIMSRDVKRNWPITVIIGNPPYSGESMNKNKWINELMRTDLADEGSSFFEIGGKSLNERNPKWLNDDYVKFLRLSQYLLSKSGWGVLGFVNNHGWLDNPTFRGMRESMLQSFQSIEILDLHGNVKKKEVSPTGYNGNVFPIQQGVCINIFQKGPNLDKKVTHADIWGTGPEKLEALKTKEIGETTEIEPISPGFLMHPIDLDLLTEYRSGVPVNEFFPLSSVAIVTARDKLTIAWDDDEIWERVNRFASIGEEDARAEFLLKRDARDWKIKLAQQDLVNTGPSKKYVRRIHYRPWDFRSTYYSGVTRGFHCMPRSRVMSNMIDCDNIGLVTKRQMVGDEARYFFVSNTIICDGLIRSDNKGAESLYPLFISLSKNTGSFVRKSNSLNTWKPINKLIPNLDHRMVGLLASKLNLEFSDSEKEPLSPLGIFSYAYALFHSNVYRMIYRDYIMKSYPRIQFTTDAPLFISICNIGRKLIQTHLLDFDLATSQYTLTGDGMYVDKGFPRFEEGRVMLNSNTWIDGVNTDSWEFNIGVHQVLDKWMKDRRERSLSDADITHYGNMITAIDMTLGLMDEIDQVIENVGGLPLPGFDEFQRTDDAPFGQSSILDF